MACRYIGTVVRQLPPEIGGPAAPEFYEEPGCMKGRTIDEIAGLRKCEARSMDQPCPFSYGPSPDLTIERG